MDRLRMHAPKLVEISLIGCSEVLVNANLCRRAVSSVVNKVVNVYSDVAMSTCIRADSIEWRERKCGFSEVCNEFAIYCIPAVAITSLLCNRLPPFEICVFLLAMGSMGYTAP